MRFVALYAAVVWLGGLPLAAQSPRPFPDSHVGVWSGILTTTAPPDRERNRIPVTLTIAPDTVPGQWIWRTVFNADTVRGLRDYRLIVRDAAAGRYATDERNGVVLEETLIDGVLISVFRVGEQVLESRYTLRGDTLTHDIVWWKATATSTTRGQGANAEQGADIASHAIAGRQRAVLTRRRTP